MKMPIRRRVATAAFSNAQKLLEDQATLVDSLLDYSTVKLRAFAKLKLARGIEQTPEFRHVMQSLVATRFTTKWLTVMLVTVVETYLQDALCELAEVDPSVMGNVFPKVDYRDLSSFDTLEDVRAECRKQWAIGIIARDGPSKWVDLLKKLGASSYQKGLVEQMERIWGIRHIVVHNAGRATRDFLSRHGGSQSVGDSVPVSLADLREWQGVLEGFIESTDRFISARRAAKQKLMPSRRPREPLQQPP